jgi:hypothetical protein
MLFLLAALALQAQQPPVIALPEPGLDDTAAYQGYKTRFYRDSRGNTVQVYITPQGRVVVLLANSANESVGFTVRDTLGNPARIEWGADSAITSDSAGLRGIEFSLVSHRPSHAIGHILLGSMRVERDFQYEQGHLRPLDAPPFRQRELLALIEALERLPTAERQRQLALLDAPTATALRARLSPDTTVIESDSLITVRLDQRTLDAKNLLRLELILAGAGRAPAGRPPADTARGMTLRGITRHGGPLTLRVRVSTDAEPLTPLERQEIFNEAFLERLAQSRIAHDSALRTAPPRTPNDSAVVFGYRRMERQVRGVELLSSRQKLMAGLPNFATYFGRDMMMTALMMRPVWRPEMSEHVIGSVLRKLSASGQVSHEEALGGQAIREAAAEYSALVAEHRRHSRAGRRARADSTLARARDVIANLQRVRENYNMLDDEFQLPVLAARYLTDTLVPLERKRAFLFGVERDSATRLSLLLRELRLVADMTAPYVRDRTATSLVAFPRRDSTRWFPGSWRDSGAGYANGRFAMDINAIWAPRALQSIAEILDVVGTLGADAAALDTLAPGARASTLRAYARSRESLRRAVQRWRGAERHFVVAIAPAAARAAIDARLAALPDDEARYWRRQLDAAGGVRDTVKFLALSLDARGRPIRVANTDPATRLFLEDLTGAVARGALRADDVLRDVRPLVTPYPAGLLIEGLGPVVANDAYSTRSVWEDFRRDLYHSPRVVWGREVNLIQMGMAQQIAAGTDSTGRPRSPALAQYLDILGIALRATTSAVQASGLGHSELWSYEITNGRLVPTRYGTSSDVQLWNLTDLAVQSVLSSIPRPRD